MRGCDCLRNLHSGARGGCECLQNTLRDIVEQYERLRYVWRFPLAEPLRYDPAPMLLKNLCRYLTSWRQGVSAISPRPSSRFFSKKRHERVDFPSLYAVFLHPETLRPPKGPADGGADVHVLPGLLHGKEKNWGGAGYQGPTEAIHAAAFISNHFEFGFTPAYGLWRVSGSLRVLTSR